MLNQKMTALKGGTDVVIDSATMFNVVPGFFCLLFAHSPLNTIAIVYKKWLFSREILADFPLKCGIISNNQHLASLYFCPVLERLIILLSTTIAGQQHAIPTPKLRRRVEYELNQHSPLTSVSTERSRVVYGTFGTNLLNYRARAIDPSMPPNLSHTADVRC